MRTKHLAIFLSLFSLVLTHKTSWAERLIKVCDITSDIKEINSQIEIETKDFSHPNSSSGGIFSGIHVGELHYSWSAIASAPEQVVVIKNDNGKDVLRIIYKDFNCLNGGLLELYYLKNGLSDSWSKYPEKFYLKKDNSEWGLYHKPRTGPVSMVSNIHVKVKTFLGVPYGIKKIKVN